LLLGGFGEPPFAGYLVKIVSHRLLMVTVGSLILLLSARTFLKMAGLLCPGVPNRSEQAGHLQERPRAQEQDQASDRHHQQPVRYDLDQVAGERRLTEAAKQQ